MERWLERLDSGASTLVPLLYLAGLMLGVAAYFSGVIVDAGLAVGISLAVAAELHSFLQQRRWRASLAWWMRLPDDAPERDVAWRQMWIHGAALAALLAFSVYNAVAFAAATWRPSPSFLPPAVQIAIRGVIIPLLFFLAGFLTPLYADATDQLARTSGDMLARTLKAIGRQWRTRLDAAQRRGADLAPIAVALLEDVGETDAARRVQMIAAGLSLTEGREPAGLLAGSMRATRAAVDADAAMMAETADATDNSPDDDPGGGLPAAPDATPDATPVQRPDVKTPRRTGNLRPFTHTRNPRRLSPSAEEARRRRAFGYLDAAPGMSKAELRRKLRCQKSLADSYWLDWQAARDAQQAG